MVDKCMYIWLILRRALVDLDADSEGVSKWQFGEVRSRIRREADGDMAHIRKLESDEFRRIIRSWAASPHAYVVVRSEDLWIMCHAEYPEYITKSDKPNIDRVSLVLKPAYINTHALVSGGYGE